MLSNNFSDNTTQALHQDGVMAECIGVSSGMPESEMENLFKDDGDGNKITNDKIAPPFFKMETKSGFEICFAPQHLYFDAGGKDVSNQNNEV